MTHEELQQLRDKLSRQWEPRLSESDNHPSAPRQGAHPTEGRSAGQVWMDEAKIVPVED